MGDKTSISWCDSTWSPWIGCTKISAGCTNCYAERDMGTRMGKADWGPKGTRVKTSPAYWHKPEIWNNSEWMECLYCGWRGQVKKTTIDMRRYFCPECSHENMRQTRQRVFCASLGDVFEKFDGRGPRTEMIFNTWRDDLFGLIERTENLDWMLLTKRPENVMGMVPQSWKKEFPRNVWMGTTVENQEMADQRIPSLLPIPARILFVSCEPLIGPVDLWGPRFPLPGGGTGSAYAWGKGINWVIAGGESGPNARPMHPDWARELRDECKAADVPFHFKQWGEWLPAGQPSPISDQVLPASARYHDFGNMISVRVGRKAAGHFLDDKEYLEFPHN